MISATSKLHDAVQEAIHNHYEKYPSRLHSCSITISPKFYHELMTDNHIMLYSDLSMLRGEQLTFMGYNVTRAFAQKEDYIIHDDTSTGDIYLEEYPW